MQSRANLKTSVLISIFFVSMTCSISGGSTIYVDDDATAGGNGENWESAYKYLQDALFYASSGDEICVGEGTYRPDEDSANPSGTGNRQAAFQLKNGVALRGGYAGFGQPDPDARDPNTHETILSGDLLGNDGPNFKNNDENSYHVVKSGFTYAITVLDGFTITSGNADSLSNPSHDTGGGMYSGFGSPIVTNCTFTKNSARWDGGGMCNTGGSPTLTNCTFSGNSAGQGGGGMSNSGGSPTLTNCAFSGNSAGWAGGGMSNSADSPTLTNCMFNDNTARVGGGMHNNQSSPTLKNCIFSGNSVVEYGGGVYNWWSAPTLTNCILSNNSAEWGGGMENENTSNPSLSGCVFKANSATMGGGGIRNHNSSPNILDCLFIANEAQAGGAVQNESINSKPTFTRCRFIGNSATLFGGAIRNHTCSPTVLNCLIVANQAQAGAGMQNENNRSNPTLINCTFSDNYANWGGGIINNNSRPILDNCILWANSDDGGTDESAQIDGGLPAVNSSCIQGWTGNLGGVGNINANPWFDEPGYRDANGVLIDGDYHLHRGSPCINAGDNSAVPTSLSTDLDGNPRIAAGIVDMGVYEFWSPLIVYVDEDAVGANNGSSWADAFNDLQYALSVAIGGDEIRVAQGVYKPAGYVTPPPPPPPPPPPFGSSNEDESIEPAVDRTATFQLKNSVVIKGGYAGFGEPDLNARDIKLYETILSGDLLGNDGPDFANNADNSYHVVTGSYCDETAVLDGFTITAGNANDDYPSVYSCGGGIYNYFGSPTLKNCTFSVNSASRDGGGMFNSEQSNPTITGCTFRGNTSIYEGGAISNRTSGPTITNCSFIGNSSNHGGGISNWPGSPILTACTFSDNSAELGGAVFNWESNPILANCMFSNNSAREWGGAICNLHESSPMVTNCTFSRNTSGAAGGGIHNQYESSPTITNCTFRENGAENGGGMFSYNGTRSTLENCTFRGNWADYGGGMFIGGSDPSSSSATLTNCTFAGNSAHNGNALACGSYLARSNLEFTNCILWNGGNEIWNNDNSVITITYSDVQGGWPGEGNIDADPCFVQMGYLSPISYWKFDEANGTTAYDSVGQNHGTVYGAQWARGQVGSALCFDGINDYVDIPYNSSLDIDASEGITLSVWFKLNSYPDSTHQGPIFGLYDSTGQGTKNYLAIGKSIYGNVVAWDQWPPSGGGITSIKPDLDTWYHVAVVEDSTHKSIYINGYLDVSDTTYESYEGNPPDTIRIGCRADDWAPFYFDGTIDEVVVYNIVLTEDEIQHHYQSGLSGKGYPPVPDYHLRPDSPCIDAGDPDYVAGPNETDLDGNPRVIGAAVDMGAYELQNTPPVANAGPDQVVECACNTEGGTKVVLDGSGSCDVDGDPLTYTWSGPFVESPVNGATPIVTLEDGCPDGYVITLVVNDGIEDSEPNEVLVTVVDTTSPEFTFSVTPTMLWPPNHKMVEITPSWTVSDECDASPDISLLSIVANEGDGIIGDGHTSNDIQVDDDGSIFVRSERSGTDTGRIYTFTYQAVDDCGNTTVRSATVSIPHDFKVLARIASRWLWVGPAGRIQEDLNGDGTVNLKDFARFAENWIK